MGRPIVAGLAVLGLAAAGIYVWRMGGIGAAGAALGTGLVNGAGGVVSGVVGAVGTSVGLPTPDETTTDTEVARWIIDNVSTFEASKWCGAPAFLQALMMPAGSGKPPQADSEVGRALLPRANQNGSGAGAQVTLPAQTGPDSVFGASPSWGSQAGMGGASFDWMPRQFPS